MTSELPSVTNRSAGSANPGSSRANTEQPSTSRATPASNYVEDGWTTLTKKGRKKKQTAPAVLRQATQKLPVAAKAAKPKKKTNLNLPRSAAVVITLLPEALEKGVTYTASLALTKAKAAIDLSELKIDGVRSRQTTTGARMLELPGASSGPKADLLAKKLQYTLADIARVVRPVKCVGLRISGLDDSISSADVVAAITAKAESSSEHIKTGECYIGSLQRC